MLLTNVRGFNDADDKTMVVNMSVQESCQNMITKIPRWATGFIQSFVYRKYYDNHLQNGTAAVAVAVATTEQTNKILIFCLLFGSIAQVLLVAQTITINV